MTNYVTFVGYLVPEDVEPNPATDPYYVIYSDNAGWKSVGTNDIEDLTDEEVESINQVLAD